ncbi:deoxyribodipyrimidine photo-lyase [Roseiarcaceae bacterium H3SJ34-1]|uniref:cryptochrome/photolyase family protein n=1 Tax=Terripilifer ovatus TaxID=3032367 RepID=UPI003AB999A4|nr:deoxyribodipyrimidine photo-lyase [Roseiarcaceae bacterium H3SJ34-1]
MAAIFPSIVWLRNDLRLADNPAVQAAFASGAPPLFIYVLDDSGKARAPGGASRWWLHHSLAALAAGLERIGGRLDVLRGDPLQLIPALAAAFGAKHVMWTRRYDAAGIHMDTQIKSALTPRGIAAESFNGQLLYEPWTMKTKTGGPYRVFTPFWRACQALPPPAEPLRAPRRLAAVAWNKQAPARVALDDLALLPTKPDWAGGLCEEWTPGEAGAGKRLLDFLDDAFLHYADERDRPGRLSTSRLSPHLAFGEISPRQIWHAAQHAAAKSAAAAHNVDKFISEIGWREFSYHLLFHNPELAQKNFQTRFDEFPWRAATKDLKAWQQGKTGYPIVDAGLRELWKTGFMHNRVRMIAASFLIKHLMIDWREGERWFWDTLVDADPANNAASWQWVAGSGADAAPFFRVFNPILQGEKFDPEGEYIRRFVPELAKCPSDVIHKPWLAPAKVLQEANIKLGDTYPKPVVDHAKARERALAAFKRLKD